MKARGHRKTGWSFKRFFYRIALPFLFVALAAVVMRVYLSREFNERHVRPDPSPTSNVPHTPERQNDALAKMDREASYSEANRVHMIAGLKNAKERLDQMLEAAHPDAGEILRVAQERKRRLEASIESLGTVDEDQWESIRSEAFDRLDRYSEAVRKLSGKADT